LAIILAGLFIGSSLAILGTLGSGNEDDGPEYGVVVTIENPEKEIPQGSTAVYWGSIENIGSENDSYSILFGGRDFGKEGITLRLLDGLAETDINLSREGWRGPRPTKASGMP
jgi:hypothetical protein